MDRSSIVRTIAIALFLWIGWKLVAPTLGMGPKSETAQAIPAEHFKDAPGFAPDVVDAPPAGQTGENPKPPEGTICKIKGSRFDAELSSRGAGITHFFLNDTQYAGTEGFDVSSTPDHERWRSLRTQFRVPEGSKEEAPEQVDYDRFNWKLAASDGTSCTFTYEDANVRIVKSFKTDDRPFELVVHTDVTNLAKDARTHELSIQAFAFRKNKDVKSHFGRVSPFVTDLSCARGKDVKRKGKDDFKEGWFSEPLVDRYVAVSNYYFAQAIVPVAAPDGKPSCELLAEDWYGAGQSRDDDESGAVYHAKLLYPPETLAPGQTATYEQIAFFGPKERNVLAKAAGGAPRLGDLINLGFFSPVAKVLVGILVFFHAHVTFGNWGLAIIAMTVCLRLLLFPLSLKPLRTSIAMRQLKPEIDALNKKFKDDMQARNMATMELYRKHGVNPLGGCLPQLVQMPIWWAMYTTLQTAVEMYHEKFLWFSDLSAPDHFYILPIVLGAFMILQQRIVPQQGMDPMQAKMMMYLLPGVFTVMMLFLPAALGVYMLTNSVLGITQQLVMEKIAPRGGGKGGTAAAAITVKPVRQG